MSPPHRGTEDHAASDKAATAHNNIPVLNGLRAVSICLVLACHLLPLGPKSLDLNDAAGLMAMGLFFSLSGFLIVNTLQTASILEFIVKRLARILPLVYLYISVVFVLYGLSQEALLAHLGFFVNYRLDRMLPVTEHLWSLCVEVHFYVLVTLLVALGGRKALVLVWPCCLAITAMRLMLGAEIRVATHLRIDEILAGGCVATLPLYRFRTGKMPLALWMLVAAAWAATSHPDGGWALYLRPYAAALLLWMTIAQPANKLTKMMSSRTLGYIAATSYALYIIHPLTAHGWWNDGNALHRYLLKRPLGVAFTLVAAHISTFWWERVWIDTARRFIGAMRARSRRSAVRLQAS